MDTSLEFVSKGLIPLMFEHFDTRFFEQAVEHNYINQQIALDFLRSIQYSFNKYSLLPIFQVMLENNDEFTGFIRMINYVYESMDETDCIEFINGCDGHTLRSDFNEVSKKMMEKIYNKSAIDIDKLLYLDTDVIVEVLEYLYNEQDIIVFYESMKKYFEHYQYVIRDGLLADYLCEVYVPNTIEFINMQTLFNLYNMFPTKLDHNLILNDGRFLEYVQNIGTIHHSISQNVWNLIEEYEEMYQTEIEFSPITTLRCIFRNSGLCEAKIAKRSNPIVLKYIEYGHRIDLAIKKYPRHAFLRKIYAYMMHNSEKIIKDDVQKLLDFMEEELNAA